MNPHLKNVIPAQAGTQFCQHFDNADNLDPRLRGDDESNDNDYSQFGKVRITSDKPTPRGW